MISSETSPGIYSLPVLSDGTWWGTDAQGNPQCRGSLMGRASVYPAHPDVDDGGTFRLRALQMVDGDYDAGGAYWGSPGTTGRRMYVAYSTRRVACRFSWDATAYSSNDVGVVQAQIFVRASSRKEAMAEVRKVYKQVRFARVEREKKRIEEPMKRKSKAACS